MVDRDAFQLHLSHASNTYWKDSEQYRNIVQTKFHMHTSLIVKGMISSNLALQVYIV